MSCGCWEGEGGGRPGGRTRQVGGNVVRCFSDRWQDFAREGARVCCTWPVIDTSRSSGDRYAGVQLRLPAMMHAATARHGG